VTTAPEPITRAVADRHARGEHGATADPDVVADGHRLGALAAGRALLGIDRMRRRVDVNARPEQTSIAERDRVAVEEHAAVVREEAVADRDVVAVVAPERGVDDRVVADRVEQLP